MRLSAIFLSAFSLLFVSNAQAEEGWSGEGSFSAGVSTGNTETSDLGLGLDLTKEDGLWAYTVAAKVEYGETESVESKNRVFLSGNVDRQLSDRSFAFATTSYEKDEFSGFESRYFLGGGMGYTVFESDRLDWSIRGGPGLKMDEVRAVETNGVVTTPAETVESFSVLASSKFGFRFNDNVSLSNDTGMIYAEESTQLTNTIALTATLTSTLSARISFDVRHDTSPPDGFEATDTATRASLVYKFGG